jgi:(1->4)-alpha-D-glucan 1-alpha-D-glucosylmutase
MPAQGLDQAALGAFRERIERHALKAAREAKAHTSWISPNEEYERALLAFVRALLGRVQPNPFLDDLRAQAATLAWFGALNSLSMALIKFTSPGVPDLYQGNELLDFSLVDPDNRRPVDFALRARLLDEVLAWKADCAARARGLAQAAQDGRAKLHVTARLLAVRRKLPDLFRLGSYLPLAIHGARAEHALAYARRHDGRTLVVIAGRLFAKLLGEPGRLPLGEETWGDTALAAGELGDGARLTNVLTGESLAVRDGAITLAQACRSFPAAALLLEAPAPGGG